MPAFFGKVAKIKFAVCVKIYQHREFIAFEEVFLLTMNSVATSFAEEIKSKTREAHLATEHLLIPRLKSVRSKEDYATILRMFYGFFQPLQEKIELYIEPKALPDIKQRRKASVIKQDIFSLQMQEKLDICEDLPTIHHLLQAFGALYVIEGSTLGGEIISRMLQKNESANLPENSLQFFKGYGDQNLPMWQRFKEYLLRQIHSEKDVETVIDAANETFVKLKNWMVKFS